MTALKIGGARVNISEAGTKGAPAAVLLHSSAMSGGQWRSLIDLLAPNFHVFAPDLYGYGKSDAWPGSENLRLADEVRIVSELLARIDTQVHLIGHSYGGAVALHAALAHQPQIATLTLYEPVAFHLFDMADAADAAAYTEIRQLADTVRSIVGADRGDNAAAMQLFVDYWNGPGSWNKLAPEAQDELAIRAEKVCTDFTAIYDDGAQMSDFASFLVPTLLLVGEVTPRPAAILASQLAARLPAAALETVAGAGHMGPVTHRQLVNQHIMGHVRIQQI